VGIVIVVTDSARMSWKLKASFQLKLSVCQFIKLSISLVWRFTLYARTGTSVLRRPGHLIAASDAAPRRRCLRSANLNCLTVPRCRLSMYGCRAFHYTGPTVWTPELAAR